MIFGVVAKLYMAQEDSIVSTDIIAGNGKTATLVYFGHEEAKRGRHVISNFHTFFENSPCYNNPDFPNFRMPEYMDAQDILDGFFDRENVCYLLSEIQKFMNSVGNPTTQKAWVEGLISQRRKLKVDIIYDSQRIMSFDNRIREHTKYWYIPRKFHVNDGTICQSEDCLRHHFIQVFQEIPYEIFPIATFDAQEIGQLYNTDEIIRDVIIAPEKQKAKKKKQFIEPEPEDQPEPRTLKEVMKKRKASKSVNLEGLTEAQKRREMERMQEA
jgi:hypothetical protein